MRVRSSYGNPIRPGLDLYLRFMPRALDSPGFGYLLLTSLFRWSVGSVLFLLSWAVLMGPWTYARHLISGARLPFTAAYFGSIALTLYFAIGVCKIYFFILVFGFVFVFGLYTLSRPTPTIPPFLMILPFGFPCFPAHSLVLALPRSGSMVALHIREKGILQPLHPSRSTT